MRVLGLALAALVALTAGCGSGDGGTKPVASAEPSASASGWELEL